jgi:hypothetical protein
MHLPNVCCTEPRSVSSSPPETTRRHKRVEPIIGQQTLKQAPLSSDHLEEAMITRLAALTIIILFAAVSLTGRAEAGASASAPTKNSRSSQLAAQQTGRTTAKNDVGITEYSSSSARNRSH